jgi:hypothetical protein
MLGDMKYQKLITTSVYILMTLSCFFKTAKADDNKAKTIVISNAKLNMVLDYGDKASIVSLSINGQKIISKSDGMFTSVNIGGTLYSSLHLKGSPTLVKASNTIRLNGISYGDDRTTIKENWTFTISATAIKWAIQRSFSQPTIVQEAAMPVVHFDDINTFDGAYQGFGGIAWFYLFNEKLCTYGVHTQSNNFWSSKTNNGLSISVDAPGKKVAMKYSRTNEDRLAYTVTVSGKEMLPQFDSGTNRRLFIRNRTDVWAPFTATASTQTITLGYFNVKEKYGRGKLAGINGQQVGAVLNTIARIGVIDSLHYGGNSWHTPYGPICLHEQYIAQMGLGINDPDYLKGYKSCLDFYRDHAILPDGRVYSRWAYTNEDAMPGKFTDKGFYEAQWGILMDANPDFVTNVAELYDLTGDKNWVQKHRQSCEKALDWILARDSNGNGLVEMMTDNQGQQKSSDWIDIIWASFENAFVNAKLYIALVKWAAIERQLNNPAKASYYEQFANRLKTSFNKPTTEGGFWDEENKCYVHWLDKEKVPHGRNMVTPVNFMAIAYGICTDDARRKTILDNIETQMQQEKLFFWPLTMTSYAPGEGKEWQFPFPNYENGDLFLSWGSVAVKAYAEYNPAIAVKYVRNVLEQYSKDGLAFQRYGRVKQDGLGDDILSGNSLSIVGLYQAIYGINPLYNRFYLNPHITPELAGTELKYYFRDKRLAINLDSNAYAVSDNYFKVISTKAFGYNSTKNQLFYFNGNDTSAALQVTATDPLTVAVLNWGDSKKEWLQTSTSNQAKPLSYIIHRLKPNANYSLAIGGKIVRKIKSDKAGDIVFTTAAKATAMQVSIDEDQ